MLTIEAFVSAVLGDLVSRSVSFVVDNYCCQQKGVDENLQRLSRVLLRIQATVEEAERRHITNQAMLRQLQMLREAMYKGCYLFDAFRYRMLQQESFDDQVGRHPFALIKFSPAKRFCFDTRRMNMAFQGDGLKEIQKMLENLHSMINDMEEFIVFLKSYPTISREPYSRHLFLEKCMFGRQAEMEKIVSFLLQPDNPGAESLQVLPIIGPPRVGKSTLVEHVCYDERVSNHFSTIILYSGDPTAPEGSAAVKKRSQGSHGRSLVIMELADDFVLDEKQCTKFYSSRSHMPPGSKVIITSGSENIVKLGTTAAIRLEFLPDEAFWQFFKVTAFGSTNPEEHPELASIAMELATELLHGSFLAANIIGGMLRNNLHIKFWRKVLELERDHVEMNILHFGEHPHNLLQKNQTAYIWTMSTYARTLSKSKTSMRLKFLNCQSHSPQNGVPKTLLHDVQTESAKAHGKLEFLLWKSQIPPYHSYTMSCEIGAPQHMMAKKKRPNSIV